MGIAGPSRRIAAVFLAALMLVTGFATSAQERHPHPQPRPHPHRESPGAGLDFLGTMLGLFGGLATRERAQPQCDVAHVGGWQAYRHAQLGHGISLPNQWRRDNSRVDATLVDIFVNPCPPHAAVLIARLPADRRVGEGDLGKVALALQQQGGELFQTVVQHEVVRAPDQSRLAVVYAGRDSGVDLGSLVHLVSTASDFYIVIGLAPRDAGERLGTVLRQSIGSFVPPPPRAAPPPVAAIDLTGAWTETTAPSARNHLVVIAHSGSDLLISGTYGLAAGPASWIGTGKVDGRQVAIEYRFDKQSAGDRGTGRMTLTATPDANRLEGVERSSAGAERPVAFQRSQVPTPAAAAADIAGTWRHQHGPNREAWRGETWTFTALGGGRYRAQEKGYGNASGTAEVKDNRVVLDYVTRDGKVRGTATMTLNADRTAMEGSFRDSQPLTGSYVLLRMPAR